MGYLQTHSVNVDLTGPYSVKTPKGVCKMLLLTAIDPATGWFEIKEIHDATSDSVSAAMDDMWFCRYLRPHKIGLDGGSEFKKLFYTIIANYGLERAQTTPYNRPPALLPHQLHTVLQLNTNPH